MKVALQYGTEGLEVELPSRNVTVIRPSHQPGLADERAGFREAVRQPIGTKPLREVVGADETLAVVIPDITRPMPNDRLLPWLFEELGHVAARDITIVNGTGSHRHNTHDELSRMVGAEVLARYRVVNHSAFEPAGLRAVGRRPGGAVLFNKDYVEADRRIAVGFIEPHFMAGFSGGYKAVMPGVADIDTILEYHGARIVGDPMSNWGEIAGNPTQAFVRRHGALAPLDFLVNVTLNEKRDITGYFCGEAIAAHDAGCAAVKRTAMAGVDAAFPIVVTTNSGYPLDQNLYQAVKGMSAAAKILAPGGLMICAARCNEGFPAHGNFGRLMCEAQSPQQLLDTINTPGFAMFDQWCAQLLAIILTRHRVMLYSEMADADVRQAHLIPTHDIAGAIAAELDRIGRDAPIAVLPEGPMTIPYVK